MAHRTPQEIDQAIRRASWRYIGITLLTALVIFLICAVLILVIA
jgi:hypothetical protein